MNSETHYLDEANALLALIRDEKQAAEWVLEDMLPGELVRLEQACDLLSSMARSEIERRKGA